MLLSVIFVSLLVVSIEASAAVPLLMDVSFEVESPDEDRWLLELQAINTLMSTADKNKSCFFISDNLYKV